MITYDNVEVRFGDFTAIHDLNLTIEEGEFFTLLGPSGCGKTTILRALAGFVTPSRGRIHIAGKDVTSLPSDKRDIGMVFQNYALFPSMTVWENIAFGLKVAGLTGDVIRQRVTDIAAEVELTTEQLERGIAELSGGQQQRVAIARAMVMRPKIMLLDEPLSNLDAKLRHQMRIQLKQLQSHFGITSVYVTHDQDEALAMSDRIAVIHEGRIEQVGTPQEVYQHSATEFVCNFLGEANRLSPELMTRLVQAGASHLSEHHLGYLRVEKARLTAPAGPSPHGSLTLRGTVVAREYHGINNTYTVNVAAGQLGAVVPDDGITQQYGIGEEVEVHIVSRDVLQYDNATSQP